MSLCRAEPRRPHCAWTDHWLSGFALRATRSGAEKANALHGGERRLSVRAVKDAGFAFIGAKRKPLTEEAADQAQGWPGRAGERDFRTNQLRISRLNGR
jgi:hypothetical protein